MRPVFLYCPLPYYIETSLSRNQKLTILNRTAGSGPMLELLTPGAIPGFYVDAED